MQVAVHGLSWEIFKWVHGEYLTQWLLSGNNLIHIHYDCFLMQKCLGNACICSALCQMKAFSMLIFLFSCCFCFWATCILFDFFSKEKKGVKVTGLLGEGSFSRSFSKIPNTSIHFFLFVSDLYFSLSSLLIFVFLHFFQHFIPAWIELWKQNGLKLKLIRDLNQFSLQVCVSFSLNEEWYLLIQ